MIRSEAKHDYFEDAELDVMPRMLTNKDWATIKNEIMSHVRMLT